MLFSFGKKPTPAPAPTPAGKKAPAPAPVPVGFANGLIGSDVEAGEFDPFKLSVGASPDTVNWYRAAELKVNINNRTTFTSLSFLCSTQHGRLAMLAGLGLLVQPLVHLPDPVFTSTLGYGAVAKVYAERPEAIWQILTALAAIETSTLFYKNGQAATSAYEFDPLNLKAKYGATPEAFAAAQLQELKNGRLAMFATSGMLAQEYVTGYGPYEQLLQH